MPSPRIFIDSNVLIAHLDSKDVRHAEADRILYDRLNKADNFSLFLSQYIQSEVIAHITRLQKNGERTMEQRKEYLKYLSIIEKSQAVKILMVSQSEFGAAREYVKRNPEIVASLVDWTSLILAKNHSIDAILTFDRDFKTITDKFREFSGIKIWHY